MGPSWLGGLGSCIVALACSPTEIARSASQLASDPPPSVPSPSAAAPAAVAGTSSATAGQGTKAGAPPLATQWTAQRRIDVAAPSQFAVGDVDGDRRDDVLLLGDERLELVHAIATESVHITEHDMSPWRVGELVTTLDGPRLVARNRFRDELGMFRLDGAGTLVRDRAAERAERARIGPRPKHCAAAEAMRDFDGDGVVDLLLTTPNGHGKCDVQHEGDEQGLSIARGRPGGGFAPPTDTGIRLRQRRLLRLAYGDLDRDGLLDIVALAGDFVPYRIGGAGALVAFGASGGAPFEQVVLEVAPTTHGVELYDHDGDAKTDIVFLSAVGNRLVVVTGTGARSLGTNRAYGPLAEAGERDAFVGMQLVDLDGDGQRELVELRPDQGAVTSTLTVFSVPRETDDLSPAWSDSLERSGRMYVGVIDGVMSMILPTSNGIELRTAAP